MSEKHSAQDKKSSSQPFKDYLLHNLVFLTQHFGHARSAESLRADLPYDEKGLSPALFEQAANRIGLNTKQQDKKDFEAIDQAALPVVLLLQDHKSYVLLSIKGAKAHVFNPETGKVEDVPIKDIATKYTGKAIFVHPASDFHGQENESLFDLKDPEKHWFLKEFYKARFIYLQVIIAAIFINIFALTSPIFIMNVYDRVIPNNALETGWVLGIGAFAIYGFDFIMRTLRGYFIDIAGRRIDVNAAQGIFDHVLNMQLAARPKSSGVFANMLREFDSVKEFITSATLTAVVDLPFTIFFLFIIYLVGGPIAFLLMLLIILVVLAGLILQAPLQNTIRKSMHASEGKHGILIETIQALETIKAIAADGKVRAQYGRFVGESAVQGQKARFISALGVNLASFLQQSASIMIVLMGMYMVADQNLTVGALIATVILGGRAIAPIGQIANLMARYHQAHSAYKTIDKIMQMPVERPTDKVFLHRPDLSGHVKFDKVCFSYPGTDVKVLDNVSFEIKAGEKVGIIGRIGSGKSTVARILMGLYQPSDGAMYMDQTDYRQIDPADLRRNIGYISQDVVLFRGTIRENITASLPHASQEDILWAAKASGVDDFVQRHPMGYDAPIGENGWGISGGQRQAIAMARALLLKPNLMLCDEPTNAMDVQAEEAFTKHILEEVKDKSLILMTHRMHLLNIVDRLILLDQGKVIMDDKRDRVLQALQTGNIGVRAKA